MKPKPNTLPQDSGEESGGSPSQHVRAKSGPSGGPAGYPSDEGDLSQQHHEEWIFLNRNTIDMKLLREIADALHRMDTDTTASARSAKSRSPPSGWTRCRGRAIA